MIDTFYILSWMSIFLKKCGYLRVNKSHKSGRECLEKDRIHHTAQENNLLVLHHDPPEREQAASVGSYGRTLDSLFYFLDFTNPFCYQYCTHLFVSGHSYFPTWVIYTTVTIMSRLTFLLAQFLILPLFSDAFLPRTPIHHVLRKSIAVNAATDKGAKISEWNGEDEGVGNIRYSSVKLSEEVIGKLVRWHV